MTAPRRNSGWKATTHLNQINAWRLDAIMWRDQAYQRKVRADTAHTLVAKALDLLDAGDPSGARLHLIDALSFLVTDDTTQKGKPR